MAGVLSKAHITRGAGYNRYWNVPAALAINLSVGQAYAFSVFNLPLSRAIGVSEPAPGDWKLSTLGWTFTIAYICLGLAAGFGGRWQEEVGPRKSGVVAACCWGGGFFIAALGVYLHQIWLLDVGYGVIGGGAIIAAPLSEALMDMFASSTSVGVWETFVVLGLAYFGLMMSGVFLLRWPAPGWAPEGWTRPSPSAASMVAREDVHLYQIARVGARERGGRGQHRGGSGAFARLLRRGARPGRVSPFSRTRYAV